VRPSWRFLNLVPRGALKFWVHLSLETASCGAYALTRGVNPTFHHQFVISHHQLTRFVSFCMNSLHSIKNVIAIKMGQNGAVVGQVPHFGPFPLLKISQRGAKKGGIPSSTKSGFQHPKRFLVIKERLLSCFEVKRPWVERGGSLRK